MRIRTIFTAVALLSFTCLPTKASAESAQAKMHTGVKNYKQQKFEEAITLFSEAKEEEPHNAELNYNLANSQFKSGHFHEALQAYNQSYTVSTNPKIQQKSLYNAGNTLYRIGKFEEAIENYKRALEINSSDMDAKFNLEFVREELKKKRQQNQNKKNGKSQNSNPSQDQEQPSKAPNQPDQNLKEPQDLKDPKSSKEQDPKLSEDQENQNSRQSKLIKKTQEDTMTPQEAEQWLRALRENPKLLGRMQSTQQGRNPLYLGKDW